MRIATRNPQKKGGREARRAAGCRAGRGARPRAALPACRAANQGEGGEGQWPAAGGVEGRGTVEGGRA